jgi:hypothetical protein
MNEAGLLESVTTLIGKQADILLALINFYGLIVIAVIGWIVNTGKDGPGVSWFRVFLFMLGFLGFFAVSFAGFWYAYERLSASVALWSRLAAHAGAEPSAISAIVWLPPREWLWGLWIFNGFILLFASILLRRGGYGRGAGS